MKKLQITNLFAVLFCLLLLAVFGGCAPDGEEIAEHSYKPSLFLSLPDYVNTPDGMTMSDDGDIILACPNLEDRSQAGVLLRINKDNKVSFFYTPKPHAETKRACPMGLDFGPDGNLYFADNQYFDDKNYKSSLIRVIIKDGKAVGEEVVVDGFKLSNAVIWKGNDVYVSDTFFDLEDKPGASGIYKISLDEMNKGKVSLKPNATDEHLIAEFITAPNERNEVAGADGLTFDSDGNLYCGLFGDGVLYKISFDKDGNVISNSELVRDPEMPCVDGIFYDAKRDLIFVTDSQQNAIHTVTTDGKREKIWENGDTDGADGSLDQPCEPLVRGDELIVVSFDIPFPGLKNTLHDAPHTLSVINLK